MQATQATALTIPSEGDVDMAPRDCPLTPKMEVKRPPKATLNKKLSSIKLLDGPVQLALNEQVLHTWDFEAHIFNPNDILFKYMTCGLYSCCSKGNKKRKMRMMMTDRRVLVKEDLYMTTPTIKEETWEAQQAMNLTDMTYVRMETGAGMGLQPQYFIMDLHFLSYPRIIEPTMYQSWGSKFFRPFVDTFVVAFDEATGGLLTELNNLRKYQVDPMALLAAIQAAQEAAASAASNPLLFFLEFLYAYFKEAFRIFLIWLKAMFILLVSVFMGLVPVAALAAKLHPADAWAFGSHSNVIRISLYRPDDKEFLANAEKFLDVLLAQRDKLLGGKGLDVPVGPADEATYPYEFDSKTPPNAIGSVFKEKENMLRLPTMYRPLLNNANVLAVAPLKPVMNNLEIIYTVLSFGIYWITDLSGLLAHTGALVLTDKSISVSSVKTKTIGKGVDHARFDIWLMPNVQMHAINTKKGFWDDTKTDLIIGTQFGNIVLSVDDVKGKKYVEKIRWRLSQAMTKDITVPVPKQVYSPDELKRNLSIDMLEKSESIISVFKCRDAHSIVAKILSLGLAEHTHTICIVTNYRIIYRSAGSNCRGKRKAWEASIPLSAVRSVFWSNFYQKANMCLHYCPVPASCTFCCCCCPMIENKNSHFYMGQPGVSLRLILGKQAEYGVVMNGKLIWYCGTDDALTKSIAQLTNVQYQASLMRNKFSKGNEAPADNADAASEASLDTPEEEMKAPKEQDCAM